VVPDRGGHASRSPTFTPLLPLPHLPHHYCHAGLPFTYPCLPCPILPVPRTRLLQCAFLFAIAVSTLWF